MANKDFYATLGVSKSASDKEIKQAYRKLARKLHPDVNPGDKTAEARFKEVNAAYEVISDPEKRKKYDRYGENWEHGDQYAEAQRQYAGRSARSSGGGPFQGQGIDLEDLFGGMFSGGGGGNGRGRSRRGADIDHRVEVTLEEAFNGTTRVLQLQAEEPCSICKGTGVEGRGTCSVCHGLGMLMRPRRLEVKIPAGVKDGSRVRVANEGQAGLGGGGKGDLYLITSVRTHDRFERRDDDLYVDLPVPLVDAVLGGEASLSTLKGTIIALKIPPETQNGQTIRLTGLGMPKLGGSAGARGDLYARVKAVLPTKLSDEQKELFAQLRETV